MKKRYVVSLGAALVVVVLLAVSRIPAAKFALLRTVLPMTATLLVKPLGGDAYWVSGGIDNTGFIIGKTGVIAIDAQMFVPTAKKQLEEIARITPKPVKTIILTHSDPDHINGLPAFARGLEIIAQENAKTEMQGLAADLNSNGFPPGAEITNYLPTRTVKDRETMELDGVPIELIHTGPAHTDGDLVIFFPTRKLVFAGDLLTPEIGPYPGIHLEKHGSSLGWIAAMKALLALDADTYVPGHGEILGKAELQHRLKASEERRAQIKALFDQGKTVDEAKKALSDVPLNGAASRFPTFVETTYQELGAMK